MEFIKKNGNRFNSINNSFRRNNQSYIYNYYQYKEMENQRGKNTNFGGSGRVNKGRRHISAVVNKATQKQNKSFTVLEENERNNSSSIQGGGGITSRMITIDQVPQVKKSELKYMLNERNKKRQKILDKINAGDKDLL